MHLLFAAELSLALPKLVSNQTNDFSIVLKQYRTRASLDNDEIVEIKNRDGSFLMLADGLRNSITFVVKDNVLRQENKGTGCRHRHKMV